MYLVMIKIVFSKVHHKKHMLWVLNRIICLDNFNAFLILISENQILKLSFAVVQPHLGWTKTLSV